MNSFKNCSVVRKADLGNGTLLFKLSPVVLFTAILVSCSSGDMKEEAAYSSPATKVADSVSSYVPGITTDTIAGVTHNFIRKADIKCKVKSVLQTTQKIEELVTATNGYVTRSELKSTKDYNTVTHFKKDSLLEQTYYTASSHLTLRVPNRQLDSVIGKITAMAEFVDYRTITSDDIKLKLFANKLAENRYKNYKTQVQTAVAKKEAKLSHSTQAQENILEKQAMADEKRIESIDLADQVNYSTIALNLYQPQSIINTVAPVKDRIEPYTPPFMDKLGQAFVNGFEVLKNIILFFANAWSVLLILLLLFLGIRKIIIYSNNKTSVAPQVKQN